VQESIANECILLLWNKEKSRATTSKQMRIRAKGRKLILWIALAMDVTTRLWLGGVVSQQRDRRLIDRLFQHVRACCQFMYALLVCTDGFAAYPKSIVRTFREKVKKQAGRGRCCLEVWPDLCIATVIKHTKKKRVVEITRNVARGTCEKAQELLLMTKGCKEFNTSFIERLNGTIRSRLASLTRKCRHAAARLATLERRSSNGVDRKSEAWLAQENTISKEKEHATSALATSSGPRGARGTDRETDSQGQIICVSPKAATRTAG